MQSWDRKSVLAASKLSFMQQKGTGCQVRHTTFLTTNYTKDCSEEGKICRTVSCGCADFLKSILSFEYNRKIGSIWIKLISPPETILYNKVRSSHAKY